MEVLIKVVSTYPEVQKPLVFVNFVDSRKMNTSEIYIFQSSPTGANISKRRRASDLKITKSEVQKGRFELV